MTILNIFLSDDDAVDVSPAPAKTATAADLAWVMGAVIENPAPGTDPGPASADLRAAYDASQVAALAAYHQALAAIRAKRQGV